MDPMGPTGPISSEGPMGPRPKWAQMVATGPHGPMVHWAQGAQRVPGAIGCNGPMGHRPNWGPMGPGPNWAQWVLGPTGPWAQLAPWRETEADVYVSRRYCCMRFQHAHCLHACSLSICIMASNPFRPLVSHRSHASPKL